MGLARLEEGKFRQAEEIFTELGDYQDSAEQLKNVETARNESIYQEAFDLMRADIRTAGSLPISFSMS